MLNLHHPGQKWDKSHCCERFKPEGAARHQLQALPGSIDEVIALLTFPVSTPENGILGFFTSGCIGKGKNIYIYILLHCVDWYIVTALIPLPQNLHQ